jgi:hypothetical protein
MCREGQRGNVEQGVEALLSRPVGKLLFAGSASIRFLDLSADSCEPFSRQPFSRLPFP